MSTRYGAVYGYGIPVDGLGDRIVPEKFRDFAIENGLWLDKYDEEIEEHGFDSTIIVECLQFEYMSLEELFASLDDSGFLDYDNGIENGGYLLYYPSYPWSTGRRAESREQVDTAIINAIQRLTDMTDDEIRSKICYISDAYYG